MLKCVPSIHRMQKSEEPKEIMQESEESEEFEVCEELEAMKRFLQSRWEQEQKQVSKLLSIFTVSFLVTNSSTTKKKLTK